MKLSLIFRKQWKLGATFLILAGITFWLVSCYPGEPLSPSETDVITTFVKKGVSFADKKTYAMPDTVAYVGKNNNVEPLDPQLAGYILTAIKNNLQEYGYTRVANPQDADVVVVSLATKTEWTTSTCYPWYWDWWWGTPGWCYPVAYKFDTGTVLIVMVDPDEAGQKSTALWVAGINGLIDSASNARERITRAINQAFLQSPYLGEGK